MSKGQVTIVSTDENEFQDVQLVYKCRRRFDIESPPPMRRIICSSIGSANVTDRDRSSRSLRKSVNVLEESRTTHSPDDRYCCENITSKSELLRRRKQKTGFASLWGTREASVYANQLEETGSASCRFGNGDKKKVSSFHVDKYVEKIRVSLTLDKLESSMMRRGEYFYQKYARRVSLVMRLRSGNSHQHSLTAARQETSLIESNRNINNVFIARWRVFGLSGSPRKGKLVFSAYVDIVDEKYSSRLHVR